jgi:hypothetical protein
MNPQKSALQALQADPGATVNARTLAALERKRHIEKVTGGWELTKRGLARLEGRLGNEANLSRMWEGKARTEALKGRTKGIKPTKRSAAQKRRDSAELYADQKREHDEKRAAERERAKLEKSYDSILGGRKTAQAVKISRADGGLFDFMDVDRFEEAGWKVTGAGSVTARPGSVRLPGSLDTYRNPAPFGEHGTARALVLLGPVTRDTIKSLQREGYDVSAAPKSLREPIAKNPGNPLTKKVYDAVKKATSKGQAWNENEISEAIKASPTAAREALGILEKNGLVHRAGRDLFGIVWAAGTPQRGLFANPTSKDKAKKIAAKKAKAFYGAEELATNPQELKGYVAPESFVDLGEIVALEYACDKFDGQERTWRHEITKRRRLFVSVDGSTIVIDPPLKITKRGIEG